MKLTDELYTIESLEPGSSADIRLLPESRIYEAHFPEKPITPGVCIIQMATELLEKLLDRHLQLKEVANAKYLVVIDPRETPKLTFLFETVSEEPDTHRIKANVRVKNAEKVFAKLTLVYECDHE